MDIFGLTPADAALSALGLNYSRKMIDVIFIQTPTGLVAFVAGFLLSTWESVKNANFKYFFIFIFISLAGLFLFIAPTAQIPTIKSAIEVYSSSNLTAQSIKDFQSSDSKVPTLLAFVGGGIDALNISLIHKVDEFLDEQFHFLKDPFHIQRLSLQAHSYIHSPIPNVGLREGLDNFIYAQYLPSLNIYQNRNNLDELTSLWPGHQEMVRFYSVEGSNQWLNMREDFRYLINDPQAPWRSIKELLLAQGVSESELEDQIMASIIQGQLYPRRSSWIHWVANIQTFFPYFNGGANLFLYVAFPFLLLATLIIRRLRLFLHYMELFVWIKSCVLCAALSFYISLAAFYIQYQSSDHIKWFWESPYFVIVSAIFLCVLPVLSFIGINQCFQQIYKHS